MSSVGFQPPNNEDLELKQLREAIEDLNSVIKNCKDAQTQLENFNVGMAKAHLANILLFARKAKKIVSDVGKGKKTN